MLSHSSFSSPCAENIGARCLYSESQTTPKIHTAIEKEGLQGDPDHANNVLKEAWGGGNATYLRPNCHHSVCRTQRKTEA